MVAARSGAAWRRPALMGHGAGSGALSRTQRIGEISKMKHRQIRRQQYIDVPLALDARARQVYPNKSG
jgi:hypothetical protein